jgi:hypothetical protein
MRICVLGWGSLIWDKHPTFDDLHGPWQLDGPKLKLEFSRISQTRLRALTLVIDPLHGAECQVSYADSTRADPEDTICDLRNREGTVHNRIGFMFVDGSRIQGGDEVTRASIRAWATERKINVVVWTDLPGDFEQKTGKPFTLDSACGHLQGLSAEGKAKAAEYVWRAPDFVITPLRQRLQQEPWFQTPEPPAASPAAIEKT